MTTLANLVKNIDPPVEITQAEYNNLTEEQKNDGTVYYIVDGSSSFQTAATTPAEASDGSGSNVQAELDKRLEKNMLVNGGTATQAGYALDARFGKTLNDQAQSLNDKFDARFPVGNIGDLVNLVTAVQGLPNLTCGIFSANYSLGTILGVTDSAIVVAKNFPSDNIINYIAFGKAKISTGSIDTTTNTVIIGKTY